MDVFQEGISKSFEPIKSIGSRVGFERGRIGRVKVSPSELAAYNLYKVLEKYPEYTKEARGQIQNYYKDFDGLETLNLNIFASVLSFLRRYPDPTPESFKDENIMEFFTSPVNFIPEDAKDKKRLKIRLKAQFLKYILAIKTYKSEKEYEENEEEYEYGEEGNQYGEEYEYGEEYGEEEYEEYEEYSE